MKTLKDLVYGKTGTLEFFKDASGGYRFRVKSNNGEQIADGESYVSVPAAKKGVIAVRKALRNPLVME